MPPKGDDKTKLASNESAICRRLRECRLYLKQGQPDFARTLGIPRERLASYEHCRAPVRFELAYPFCQQFNVSLRWLATGQWPQDFFTPITSEILDKIDIRELFSSVYEKHLRAAVEARYKEAGVRDDVRFLRALDFTRAGATLAESHLENVLLLVGSVTNKLDEPKKLKFAQILEAIAFACDPETGNIDPGVLKIKTKAMLDIIFGFSDDACVQNEIRSLPELLGELRRLTSEHGRKKALADEMNVTRQAVVQWLSGASKPSAEMTFALIRWVKEQSKRSTNKKLAVR